MSKKSNQKPGSKGSWWLYSALIFLSLVLYFTRHVTPPKPAVVQQPPAAAPQPLAPVKTDNEKGREGAVLFQKLFDKLNPHLPENAYFPKLAREKMLLVYEKNNTKEWDITVYEKGLAESSTSVMFASYHPSGMPFIGGSGITIYNITQGVKDPENDQMFRDYFLNSLVHEAVHLENDQDFFKSVQKDSEVNFSEELRVWHKTILGVVRPLRQMGRPADIKLAAADEILKLCQDDINCQAFQVFVKERITP